MTVDDPIPSADDADLVEQSVEVESDDDDYPATSHDSVDDEADAMAPVSSRQRH